MPETIYPNTFYRVSVKALIKNTEGKFLVLKENQDTWSLPGGGLDHGEDPVTGVKRELKEELNIDLVGEIVPCCIKTFYLESKQAWLMWVVFAVKTEVYNFELGEGVAAAQYIDPTRLKDSTDIFEKLVYEVTHETL